MQFIFDKGVYKAARISGPEHNFLGLRFDKEYRQLRIIDLVGKSAATHKVAARSVFDQILVGATAISAELGEEYAVSEAFFISSDTPSDTVYTYLTMEIIKRIHSNRDLDFIYR